MNGPRDCTILCNMIWSLQHHQALSLLSMHCSWCASAVFWTACADASVSPRAHLFRACKPLLGLSVTTARDLVNDVHLWNLDSLLLHLQARLDRCCRQRRSDRLLLRGSDVSEMRLVVTSHVLHGGMRDLVLHCLAIKLLIWTLVAAAASGCFCRVLIVALILTCPHPLWVRSFHPLQIRSSHFFFTLVLVKAAGTSRCFRLSVAPCTTFSRRTVRLCAACSMTCCALSAGLTSLCSSRRRPALVANLSVDASVILLFCFGLWIAIPPKLREQRSTLLLTCSHCCVGRVPRGQWARLDSDTLVLIDRSACLLEPCACD